jgi:predicted ATPase
MFIKRLALKNVLSFEDSNVELGQLNVLIGPNAVGKSNLIEAISLLHATPTGLAMAMLRGGGVRQWLWLRDRVASPMGSLECDVLLTSGRQVGQLAYRLEFSEDANGFVIVGEYLANDHLEPSPPTDVYFVRNFNNAEFGPKTLELTRAQAQTMTISPTESVLAQFKNPFDPTPITNLATILTGSRFLGSLERELDHPLDRVSPHPSQKTFSAKAARILR